MRLALTHPQHGYYARQNTIGRSGDFVTSPEISQIFGEMTALWLYMRAKSFQKPFNMIELGPGKGTLISDILRTWSRFDDMMDKLKSITLVEKSEAMISKQQKALAKLGDFQASLGASSKKAKWKDKEINWVSDYEEVRDDYAPMVLAHEFFDAMPVHQFQMTNEGLREILVALDDTNESNEMSFRFILSQNETPACKLFQHSYPNTMKPEMRFEWSLESGTLVKNICNRIAKYQQGLILAIDYGRTHPINFSFRGIKNHQFTHPLAFPGESDVTADVDFGYLTQVSKSVPGMEQFHVLTQSEFLIAMGAQVRQEILLKRCNSQTLRDNLSQAYHRLTHHSEMGSVYKFWTTAYRSDGKNEVFPFSRK